MREYSRSMCRTTSTGSSPTLSPTRIGDHAEMRNRGGRTILRETCSQPVSPQLIPRIEIHDLCDSNFSTGSEVGYTIQVEAILFDHKINYKLRLNITKNKF